MNRALRRGMNKKNALRRSRSRRGGGFSLYGPVVPFDVKNDWDFSVGRGEIARPGYNDCYFNARPGELFNQVTAQSLATAQTPMVGGRRGRKSLRRRRMNGGGCGCGLPPLGANGPAMSGGGCGCMMQRGGKRSRKHRGGGTYGFATDPNYSIGGNGPIAVPEYNPVPCNGIISPTHALNPPGPFLPDPRAPADLYSLYPTPASTEPTGYVPPSLQSGGKRSRRNRKVRGGEYSSGNAYPERCYHAPGSSLPVYNASTAGFFFSPSTDKGVFEPDGVTGYMEVNPTAARVGGGKRRSVRNRKAKKSKRTRKH